MKKIKHFAPASLDGIIIGTVEARTDVMALKADQPIGVFDSGVGGLTVAKEFFTQMPGEKIIYLGDTAHVPYGSRTVAELRSFADQIVDFLIAQGAKMIVAACNTSSAVSLDCLRARLTIPIIGVIEPGIRLALEKTHNGKIGVIATEATVKSRAFPRIAQTLNPQVQVFGQACPRLVPLVEKGYLSTAETKRICLEDLEPLIQAQVDTLILGCTHYPFLRPVIQEIMGERVQLVDPAWATTIEVQQELRKLELLNQQSKQERHVFYSTGPAESFLRVGQQMVGDLVQDVVQVQLDLPRESLDLGLSKAQPRIRGQQIISYKV